MNKSRIGTCTETCSADPIKTAVSCVSKSLRTATSASLVLQTHAFTELTHQVSGPHVPCGPPPRLSSTASEVPGPRLSTGQITHLQHIVRTWLYPYMVILGS